MHTLPVLHIIRITLPRCQSLIRIFELELPGSCYPTNPLLSDAQSVLMKSKEAIQIDSQRLAQLVLEHLVYIQEAKVQYVQSSVWTQFLGCNIFCTPIDVPLGMAELTVHIHIHAQFPKVVMLNTELEPDPTNWEWKQCVTSQCCIPPSPQQG